MKSLWKDEIAVIEFGSFTRPFCAMAAQAMEILAYLYASRVVRSVFIYTREAHPGENYRHHTSIEDKRARMPERFANKAASVVRSCSLIFGGSAHQAYGLVPNMTWIIARSGFIHYKSAMEESFRCCTRTRRRCQSTEGNNDRQPPVNKEQLDSSDELLRSRVANLFPEFPNRLRHIL